MIKNSLPYLALAGGVIFLDRLTKYLAKDALALGESRPIISEIFSLTRIHNPGGIFGLFPQRGDLFLLFSLIVLIGVVALFLGAARKEPWPIFLPARLVMRKSYCIGLALVLGGGIGNFVDRIKWGYVLDFFDLHFWPVFNVADMSVTVGAGLLIILLVWPSVLLYNKGEK
ncbi:signal peptidase II [Candidatus Bipolaricaulota bacterium]|nr:signal peptidase II [Candidatus Bipolaricaulota bacterium]HBR10501.1 signal peptidase II [Candidatus Acetothermia bacterium]